MDRDQSRSTSPKRSEIVPYVLLDGEWTVADEVVKGFYLGCVDDGTSETVFFDGSIDSPERFLETVQNPRALPVFLFVQGRPAAFAWLNGFCRHSAFAHFCVMKWAWGELALEMGRKTIAYWLGFRRGSGAPLLHLIIGTIPSVNRRAVRFVAAIGFKVCGRIPKMIEGRDGNLHAADLVYLERN